MALLVVNGRKIGIDVEPEMPLLWALRDEMGLVGTKFGCGAGLCGACTVLIDGEATRSCQTAVSQAEGKSILTIVKVFCSTSAWMAETSPAMTARAAPAILPR